MKIITVLIGATLCIVLLGSVLAPTINNVSDPEESDDLYVYLLAGQSNSAYYNANVSVANENQKIPEGAAYYYGTDSAPISCGTITNMSYDTTFASYGIHSMTDSSGDFTIGNIEAPFASKFYNESRQKCLIVNAGIGGISINSYVPGTTGYNYAKAVLTHALADVPSELTVKMASIIWIQGESDAAISIPYYISQFSAMYEGLKSEFGFDSILISQTRAINGGNASVAQKLIPGEVPGAYLSTTAANSFEISDGTLASDNLHYTQKGDNILGKALAETALSVEDLDNSLADYKPLLSAILIIVILSVIISVAFLVVKPRN